MLPEASAAEASFSRRDTTGLERWTFGTGAAGIVADASLSIQKRALVDTLSLTNGGPANGATGSDTVTGLSFGVSYAPVRNLALNCNLGYQKRDTTSTLSSDYSSNRVGCTASYTLQ